MPPNTIRSGPPGLTLDRIDFALIDLLQKDARRSNKELAAAVGLAPSSCLERVRRLQAHGVILGFHARVDPGALGIALQAMIAVRLGEHSVRRVDAFMDEVAAHPAVLAVFYISGATDFLVHVVARGTEDLRRIAVDVISARPEVAHVETSLVFDLRRSAVLPAVALEATSEPAKKATKRRAASSRGRGRS